MKIVKIIVLCIFQSFLAQEEITHSIYFETDKFDISEIQKSPLLDFVVRTDTAKIQEIEIYGYCDDVGKQDYNFILSNNRATEVQKMLIDFGIKNKIILKIEGKGSIIIEDDLIENLPEIRSKNRRVDLVIRLKPQPKSKYNLPGVYHIIQKNHEIGDRILLENVLFERASSVLNVKARNELDKNVTQLLKNKNYHIEIQGHVCCTPLNFKEAIDKDTKKRELSTNRAKAVYKYLLAKNIPKSRMTFVGYGNKKPLGLLPAQDRRVEIVIVKI
ncbi:MAG: OmpA family protein [Flavobacterium sp.]|jgi:outer membrane protein OmpA-like peptidoglycan-associated protein